MLGLQVTFLTGAIAARREDDDRAIEWPPHPARLFAALAAAFFENGEAPAEEGALRWLEAQDPPRIWADGIPGTARIIEAFVPVNDVRHLAVLPELRGQHDGRKPRTFVGASLSDPDVLYGWTGTPTPEVIEGIDALAARVSYLGHSSSLVRVLRVPIPDREPTWEPATAGTLVFRGTFPGMLDALRQAHRRYLAVGIRGPLPSVPYGYAPRSPPAAAAPLVRRGPFETVWSFRQVAGPTLPALAVVGVTTAFHRALLARWGDLARQEQVPPLPEIVSGHDAAGSPSQHPHVAILGLPAVGHPRSDGHLIGLGIALPSTLPDAVRRALWRVAGEIRDLQLRPQGWSLELLGRTSRTDLPVALSASTWCRPAQVWGSVTPVVLDRYPSELFGSEAEEIIRTACIRIGLPSPVVVSLSPISPVAGAPPSRRFPGYPPGTAGPRVHALLVFPEPVAGPLLLGRGRYRGLGLFYPLGG